MAKRNFIEATFLNIVATPHPKGTYERVLRSATGKPVNFWGAEFATITKPHKVDDGEFINFRLLIWTEVDPKAPVIRKSQLEREAFPTEGRSFAEAFGVNGKVFYCVFDTSNHLLTIETKNDEGATISPMRLERIFSALLSVDILGVDESEVQVTVLPEEGALSYVLGFSRIDKVELVLKIPNQDDITEETYEVMEELRRQNVKQERREYIRQPKTDGIQLNDENKTIARVAAHNGFVKASGLNEDGEHDKRSTKEIPRIIKRPVEQKRSFLTVLRQIAKDAQKFSS